VAIIDVDCAELNGFEEEDRVGLEELARLIAASTDF
jgi:L-methionine (R)-S-oxide reductase